MTLKRYDAVVNGTQTILLLNAEDAEKLGDRVKLRKEKITRTKAADVQSKAAEVDDTGAESDDDMTGAADDNKAADVQSKVATAPATK